MFSIRLTRAASTIKILRPVRAIKLENDQFYMLKHAELRQRVERLFFKKQTQKNTNVRIVNRSVNGKPDGR